MNSRLVMNQVAVNIKGAEDVFTGLSTFETNPGVLVLDYPGSGTDVIIDTYEKDLTIGGQIVTIRKLRIKEGSSDYVDITNDKVEVLNFFLTDMTRDNEKDNINVELTLGTNDSTISSETSISLRQ
jgi:AAA+ superfamily predicted ATPase